MVEYIPYLVPCFCCLFWMVTLLLGKNGHSPVLKAGVMAFLFMGIASFIRFISLLESYGEHPSLILDIVEVFCVFGFLSCLALLFRILIHTDKLRWRDCWVFLPGFLFTALLLVLYLRIGQEGMSLLIYHLAHSYAEKTYPDVLSQFYCILYLYVYKMMVILFVNGLLIYGWNSQARYPAMFRFLFLLLLFALFLLTWDFMIYIKAYTLLALYMCIWGAALYYLGYHLSRVSETPEERAHEPGQATEENYSTPDKTEVEVDETWIRIREKLFPVLQYLMEEEQVFLQPHLRLDELALKANTNRTYLSRLLNEEYGCGFSEYIGRKRIDYACALIPSDRNLTLEQVAAQSGFIHGATFSRVFKQYTGMTFREWQRENSEL